MGGIPQKVRQAVVIVHGMGEQRPLDMLNRFIHSAIPGKSMVNPETGYPVFYSTPDDVSNSYEARRYLAQDTDRYAQTEFFEYHWSHLMQGNKLEDLWQVFRRILFMPIWQAPSGLKGLWLIVWALILWIIWLVLDSGMISEGVTAQKVISAIVGGGLAGTAFTWLLLKFLPGKITATFVDVVRYLDTSPRSYSVRKNIRKGMVELLQSLHDKGRYQRITVVAHSLGAYIAYDGICYLWTEMNQKHCADQNGPMDANAIDKLEEIAKKIIEDKDKTSAEQVEMYQKAQRNLWKAMREQGGPWLITDFITLGTPMYMADKLMTRNRHDFDSGIEFRHIPTCPPQKDLPGPTPGTYYTYSYPYNSSGKVIYHAAPFAVVRWTNMWFPAHLGFFGDWFGGPLSTLFGYGIKDIEIEGNKPYRFIPAMAHTKYFKFPKDESKQSVTGQLQTALDLDSKGWLGSMLNQTPCPKEAPLKGRLQPSLEKALDNLKQELIQDNGT